MIIEVDFFLVLNIKIYHVAIYCIQCIFFERCKHRCVSLSSDHSFSHWHEIQRIIDAHSLRQTEMFVARQRLYNIN